MPSYQTGGLNIRLAVADLNKTTTPYPLTHQNRESLANAERSMRELTECSTTIPETPLFDSNGCSLGFLGQYRDMPFLISHAKPPPIPSKGEVVQPAPEEISHEGDSQDSPLTELSSPGSSPSNDLGNVFKAAGRFQSVGPLAAIDHTNYQNTTLPGIQALCLRIQPTKKTFLCPSESRRVKWGHGDMKIDIFLNGDLCSSSYIPESAFYKKDSLRDTFSGVRIGWVTEKPWVVVPSASKIPDNTGHSIVKDRVSEDVEGRWKEIAQALQSAANAYGRTEKNELSPTSDYLHSLAGYQMPVALPWMLEARSRKYAIIDVVVVVGKGRKENASAPYLMNPMPLKLETSRNPSPARVTQEISALEPRKRIRKAHPTRSAADSEILSQGFSLEYRRRGSAGTVNPTPGKDEKRVLADLTNGHGSKDNAAIVPKQSIIGAIKAASTSIANQPSLSIPAMPTKRNGLKYHDVIDTRQTWEEELKGIIDQAADDAKRIITRSKPANSLDTPNLPSSISTAPTTAKPNNQNTPRHQSPSKILRLKYGSPTRLHPAPLPAPSATSPPPNNGKRKYTDSSTSSPDLALSQLHPLPLHASSNAPKPELKLDIPSIPNLPAPTSLTHASGSTKPQARIRRTKQVYQQAKPFEMPALSQDSIVSYAEGDMVRQVRSERGGWFREDAVLVGMRFVVS
ncbi:MAG: hypothetical protein LQ337_005999 [Flavoplaca oasis]|nr:MAG: hypothetical protein LQ337_005999 [Flavoplaca oasis]